MAEVLGRILPQTQIERVLVKVTWHGYATGTFTDAAALDLLLGALPAPAIVLEGHTSSRNLAAHNSIGRRRPRRIAPGSGNRRRNSCVEPDSRRF
jgi:hypothetical protein